MQPGSLLGPLGCHAGLDHGEGSDGGRVDAVRPGPSRYLPKVPKVGTSTLWEPILVAAIGRVMYVLCPTSLVLLMLHLLVARH